MTDDETTPEARMTGLARTFPCVAKAAGVNLWTAKTFDTWASRTPISHGELVTARFLLAVWDSDYEWQCGRFDLMEALRVWDEKHRSAFLAWAKEPWRP